MWNYEDEVVIEGNKSRVRITINVADCEIDFQNLTQYPTPSLWEMYRAEATEEENKSAYENWLHSLNPAYISFLRNGEN